MVTLCHVFGVYRRPVTLSYVSCTHCLILREVRMLSVPASSCRLVGTLGMLFLFTLAIPVQAAERRGLGRAG